MAEVFFIYFFMKGVKRKREKRRGHTQFVVRHKTLACQRCVIKRSN